MSYQSCVSDIRLFLSGGGYVLIHNDANSIVEQAFAKDDRIQLRVDFVLLKDGQNRDRIRRRKC